MVRTRRPEPRAPSGPAGTELYWSQEVLACSEGRCRAPHLYGHSGVFRAVPGPASSRTRLLSVLTTAFPLLRRLKPANQGTEAGSNFQNTFIRFSGWPLQTVPAGATALHGRDIPVLHFRASHTSALRVFHLCARYFLYNQKKIASQLDPEQSGALDTST